MASERSKRRDFLSLSFITKSISTKLLIKVFTLDEVKELKFGFLVFTVEPQSIS